MQKIGLIARVTKVTHRAPGLRRFLAAGENLRSDGAVPNSKNKVWVADVTYLKVKKQWHYLSVIMDLYSRRVIGWSLDDKRTTQVTRRTLQNAVRKRRPEVGQVSVLIMHIWNHSFIRWKLSWFAKQHFIQPKNWSMLWQDILMITTTGNGCIRESVIIHR